LQDVELLEAATSTKHCVDHANLMGALHIYHQVIWLADRLTLQFQQLEWDEN
jgi:hypothetical protein